MENTKLKYVLIILFAIGVTLISCGNKSNDSAKTEQSAKQGKEYTSVYVCPMHCDGSGSHEAGKCPVCGMDYVQNKEHADYDQKQHDHEGHDHEGHDHEGHDHEGHNH